MRRVIVNSTPIITLCNIGKLHLLKDLYGQITIPQAVYEEITAKQDSACQQIQAETEWIVVEHIHNFDAKRMYQAKLHAGEVEVMILAQEEPKADLLIIDDAAAKKTAKYLGLTVTGTLGVLLKAKQQGYLDNVKECLRKMQAAGFYISPKIVKLVLEQAHENHSYVLPNNSYIVSENREPYGKIK